MIKMLCDIYSIKANATYPDDLSTMLSNSFKKLYPDLVMF